MPVSNLTSQFVGGPSRPHGVGVIVDPLGRAAHVVAVKVSCDLVTGRIAAEQEAVQYADLFSEDGQLVRPSDLIPLPSGTNVLLVGHARRFDGAPFTSIGVALQVGRIRREAIAFGPRTWLRAGDGHVPSDGIPTRAVALTPALAFGGSHGKIVESRNPLGIGAWDSSLSQDPEGCALPQVEDARYVLRKPGDSAEPALFCALAPHWEPRRGFAGTYDEAWRTRRAPFAPSDFDPRFWNVAPPPSIHTPFLRGGEHLSLEGMGARVEIAVPRFEFRLRHHRRAMRLTLSILRIDADIGRLELTYTTHFRMPPDEASRARLVELSVLHRSSAAMGTS